MCGLDLHHLCSSLAQCIGSQRIIIAPSLNSVLKKKSTEVMLLQLLRFADAAFHQAHQSPPELLSTPD